MEFVQQPSRKSQSGTSGRGGASAAKPLQMAWTALRVEDCLRGVVQVSHISHTDIRVLIHSVIGSALQHPLAL